MRRWALWIVWFAATPAFAQDFWNVDDVRPGMRGVGRTVLKGTKIESFSAEVLGVLRNTSPGRDLVLCRLSGLDLENSGVIQGMSGSPIRIDGKLLGAVAFAWPFGKLPIAGVTPFVQMRDAASALAREAGAAPKRVGLAAPIEWGDKRFAAVDVAPDFRDPPEANDALWLAPMRTPITATRFSRNSLASLGDAFRPHGLVPVQGGGVGAAIAAEAGDGKIEPGAGLAIAFVTGDFDMSGIGTVTHVEGKRVWGFGHPMMSLGPCEFPLMTGYTHVVMPRLTVSFKMGTPLKTVGAIDADVSTCVAGWLDRPVDMLPMKLTVRRAGTARAYQVQVVRQKQMLPGLVSAVLANAIDLEGDLPDDATARTKIRVALAGRPPVTIDDALSGPPLAGPRGPINLYTPAMLVAQLLANNSVGKVRIDSVEAETEILPGRRTAEIEAVEPETDLVAPGDTLVARVTLRPFQGLRQRIRVSVKLPIDLPEGSYTALVGDGLNNARQDLRDQPHLALPGNVDALTDAVRTIASARRTQLVLRVPTQDVGVALGEQALPDLPASVVQILGSGRRSGALPIAGAVVGRVDTDWVLLGADSFRFTVAKNRRVTE